MINWWIFRRTAFYRQICEIRRKCYRNYLLATSSVTIDLQCLKYNIDLDFA